MLETSLGNIITTEVLSLTDFRSSLRRQTMVSRNLHSHQVSHHSPFCVCDERATPSDSEPRFLNIGTTQTYKVADAVVAVANQLTALLFG